MILLKPIQAFGIAGIAKFAGFITYSTKVILAQCGSEFFNLSDLLYCDSKPSAQEYEFKFMQEGEGFSETITTGTA